MNCPFMYPRALPNAMYTASLPIFGYRTRKTFKSSPFVKLDMPGSELKSKFKLLEKQGKLKKSKLIKSK